MITQQDFYGCFSREVRTALRGQRHVRLFRRLQTQTRWKDLRGYVSSENWIGNVSLEEARVPTEAVKVYNNAGSAFKHS